MKEHSRGHCALSRVSFQAGWVFPSAWNGRQVCGSAEDRQGLDVHSEEDLCWGLGRGGASLT